MSNNLREKVSKALGGSTSFDVYLQPKNDGVLSIGYNELSAYSGQSYASPWEHTTFDGDKFFAGFGNTEIQSIDYWTLRRRSAQLFNTNLYARGIIRRLITNEINTGLTPESIPDMDVLGISETDLVNFSESIETRNGLWANSPKLCDYNQRVSFGAIQRQARLESFVTGDVLVVLRQSAATKLPMVQLISGNRVMTPLLTELPRLRDGHNIRHGVEFDKRDRIVAYWVKQDDGDFKRLPAKGEKSGRVISWLVYGTDKRLDDVRGQPLLSIILQSLNDIDKYRDSTQRKALLNSFFAYSVEKSTDKIGSLPGTGGAVRKDTATVKDGDGTTRKFKINSLMPGIAVDELQQGEKMVQHKGDGTDINFPTFEEAITAAMAWCYEIPPEILRLAFSNNYSASQAAINEFKIYLNKVWTEFGENFCTPIFVEHLISECLLRKNKYGDQILRAWRDNTLYDVFAAWTSVEWYGSIKPSTDMVKQTKGSEALVRNAWSTNAREARITTGTKFSRNVRRLKTENAQLAEALEPMLELKQKYGEAAVNNASDNLPDAVADAVVNAIEDN